ncbi:MAG: hypothetical protein QM788_17000 [Roseateles sp.]|uniref:hypothetical protein n=1 Tax=Roseateles sp. TaxID=1971397 RepID=UPI0039E7B77E
MNKSILLASLLAAVALTACSKKEPEVVAPAPVVEAASEAASAVVEAASEAASATVGAAEAAASAVVDAAASAVAK